MKKLIAILMVACMLLGSVTAFAAGDVTVTTDNPAVQRIFFYNYNGGYGTGNNTQGAYIDGGAHINSASLVASPTGAVNDKSISVGKGSNFGIKLPGSGLLEAGWYRVDFDAAGTAGTSVAIMGRIRKSSSTITISNITTATIDTTFANDTLGAPLGLNGGVAGQYNVNVYSNIGEMTTISLFFKATGTDYYALHLYRAADPFYVDNVALYKIGDASLATPPTAAMGEEELAGKKVKFTSTVFNKSEAPKDAVLIQAAYDNENNLIDVDFKEYNEENENQIAAGNYVYADTELDFTQVADTSDCTVKTYLWDGFSTITPYAEDSNPVGNVVVKKWDFEDGSTQGWSNGGIAGVTVENTTDESGVFSGSRALKVTFPATDTFMAKTSSSLTANNTNYFYLFTDDVSFLDAKYGEDAQYVVKMNARSDTGNLLQIDLHVATFSQYDAFRGGKVTSATTNVWGDLKFYNTVAAGAQATNEGDYYSWNKPSDYFKTWYSATSSAKNFSELTNWQNASKRFVFRFRGVDTNEAIVYIDDITLEKVN